MELTRFTWHGGGLAAARAQFGDGAWLDLSTGINPCPWPHAAALPVDWQALPDEAALRDLERAAAAHFGCAAEHVCAVPGTEIGLRLVGALLTGDLPGGGGFHAAPAYRTHGDMLRGSVAVDDPLAAPAGHLVLANPNNPDGRLLTPAMLQAMLHQRGEGGWLLAQPHVTSVIVGAKRLDQLEDNLGAVDLELSADELKTLDAASALPAEYPGWMIERQGEYRQDMLSQP